MHLEQQEMDAHAESAHQLMDADHRAQDTALQAYIDLMTSLVVDKHLRDSYRGSDVHKEFRLGWSLFRRAHQAVAKRCHKASGVHPKRRTTAKVNFSVNWM